MPKIVKINTRVKSTRITFKNGKTALIPHKEPYSQAMLANALNAFALNADTSYEVDKHGNLTWINVKKSKE